VKINNVTAGNKKGEYSYETAWYVMTRRDLPCSRYL